MSGFKSIIGNLDIHRPTIIWGAGISGLLLGYYLKKSGIKFSIKESSARAGGKIHTSLWNNNIIEKGANALFLNNDVYELLEDLKLNDLILKPKKSLKRYIFKNSKLKSVLSQIPLFYILKNLFSTTPLFNELLTVKDFFRPWIGDRGLSNLVNPALSGIYACTSDQILLNTLFEFDRTTYPKNYFQFLRWLKKSRFKVVKPPVKGSVGLKGGMITLINALTEYLKEEIQYNVNENPDFINSNNILCASALDSSKLIEKFDKDISSELYKIEYRKLITSTVFLNHKVEKLKNSFGVVFSKENLDKPCPLGILANSEIFPQNYNLVSSYTIISNDMNLNFSNVDEIVNTLKPIDQSLSVANVIYFETKKWSDGLPLYNKNRFEILNKIRIIIEKKKGVVLFGNYVAGISIREMCSAAKEFSKKLSDNKIIDPHVDVSDIIYGPVISKRHGKSLGVNVGIPNNKICTWSCLYCQCGFGERREFNDNDSIYDKDKIISEVKKSLKIHSNIDVLTFAGNTEPGTHPDIKIIIQEIIKIRHELNGKWKIVILSNGSELDKNNVVDAFNLADETWLKLDTGLEDLFHRANRPLSNRGNLNAHIKRLKKIKNLRIQTLLWCNNKDISLSNFTNENLQSLILKYRELNPIKINITTITRDPALTSIEPVNYNEEKFQNFLKKCNEFGIADKISYL